jgi:hypothetical protein
MTVAPILDFIEKMSHDPQSVVEEHTQLGVIRAGTNLHFWLGNADATATVRFEGLVQAVGRDGPPSFETVRPVRALGQNAIVLSLKNDWKKWHVTFRVDDQAGNTLISVDAGGDDHYYRDRQHHWFFEFNSVAA